MAIIDNQQLKGYTGGMIVPGNMSREFLGALINRVGEAIQAFAVGVPGDIIWGDEIYDVGDWFDDTASKTVFTVPAGVSMVRTYFCVRVEGPFSVTDQLSMQYRQNGVVNQSIGAAGYRLTAGLQSQWCLASPAFSVSEGDDISVQVDSVNTIASVFIAGSTFAIERVVC